MVRQAQSDLPDETDAVRELSERLDAQDAKVVLVFCSPKIRFREARALHRSIVRGPRCGLHDDRADRSERLSKGRHHRGQSEQR